MVLGLWREEGFRGGHVLEGGRAHGSGGGMFWREEGFRGGHVLEGGKGSGGSCFGGRGGAVEAVSPFYQLWMCV